MKNNIDLTRNRMFNRRINREFDLWHILTRIPWNLHPITSDSELTGIRLRFFPVGNREERKRMRKAMLEESSVYCDRCGMHIARIPWGGLFGLCKKCEETVFKPYRQRIPWQHLDKEEPEHTNLFIRRTS